MQLLKNYIPKIHEEGVPFVLIFAIVTFIISMMSTTFGWIFFVATCWCIYFFRNPDRVTPTQSGLVISPADGFISKIENAQPPQELGMGEEEMTRISIFLSIFDVHVNRIPVDGTVSALHYRPGKFLNASLDKASTDNERQSLRITTSDGKDIACVQIAGLIARRIVCDAEENSSYKAGERFGIIRFGSRVDVYLPAGTNIQAIQGQYVLGGESVLADLTSNEAARDGEVR